MRKSIVVQMLLVVAATLIIEGLFFYTAISYGLRGFATEQSEETRAAIIMEKRTKLRDLVQLAISTVDEIHARSKDIAALKRDKVAELRPIVETVHSLLQNTLHDVEAEASLAEAKARITAMITRMRYDDGNYLWITDLDGRMIAHPIRADLNGKDLSDATDPNGKHLFREMARVAAESGAGTVDYLWAKPGEETPKQKVSYVKLIPELGWIVGTGAWVEDITEELKQTALEQIRGMRLADGNYLWINTLEPRMVMHPVKPELNGKPLGDMTDTKGKHLFVEFADVAREEGQGFVDYHWSKPGQEGDFPKLSYVKLFRPWGWVIGMGVYMDDVQTQVDSRHERFAHAINTNLNITALLGFVIVLGALATISALMWIMLKRPVGTLVQYAERVAEGDHEATLRGRFHGELLTLKNSITAMLGSLRDSMADAEQKSAQAEEEAARAREATAEAEEAREMAEQAKRQGMLESARALEGIVERITTASEELSAQADLTAQGAHDQKERLDETATAMEQMNHTVMEVARNASNAAENADNTRQRAVEGQRIVADAIEAISSVHTMASVLKDDMGKLETQVESIGGVIGVINDIADQTNLLALNAAIEAARAGEAGRGFAVVAGEVRKLAEKTMSATKEVAQSISGIQDSTRSNAAHVDKAATAVKEATSLANESGKALEAIVTLAEGTAEQVSNIATASEEQSAASDEINRVVEEVNSIATTLSDGMDESRQALQEVASQSSDLRKLIDKIMEENS
ncbi:methyl-accepting chemotaxis protein [Desulfobaculum sp.]